MLYFVVAANFNFNFVFWSELYFKKNRKITLALIDYILSMELTENSLKNKGSNTKRHLKFIDPFLFDNWFNFIIKCHNFLIRLFISERFLRDFLNFKIIPKRSNYLLICWLLERNIETQILSSIIKSIEIRWKVIITGFATLDGY